MPAFFVLQMEYKHLKRATASDRVAADRCRLLQVYLMIWGAFACPEGVDCIWQPPLFCVLPLRHALSQDWGKGPAVFPST